VTATLRQSERERVRRTLGEIRYAEQTVKEHDVVNEERKSACEQDIYLFLRTYFPKIFFHDFTEDQRAMIDAILHRLRYGGCQAIAAPRGGGKTMITSFVTLYCLLFGQIKFAMVVGATRPKAIQVLDNIKKQLRRNKLLLEDFPKVCCYVRYVAEAPQRAGNCKGPDGELVNMVWHQDHIVLPTREGSAASGGMVSATGITADDIRGQCIDGVRPDLVILDDVDTRESATSETQTETREKTIQEDIMGLAAPGQTIAVVMLCTVINRKCLAYLYTEPKIRPAWHGRRYRLLVSQPANTHLWQEYMQIRLSGMESGKDPDGRAAHAFYLANRGAMDDGAEVSNPHVHSEGLLPDGTKTQESALQYCYDKIADATKDGVDGWLHFATEYQNDPPEESGPQESGITPLIVASRTNAFARREVPPDCSVLTLYVDLGKYGCHWTASAWRQGGIGFVIDYGVAEVFNMGVAVNDKTVDLAILNALRNFKDQLEKHQFLRGNEPVKPDMVLVDSSDFTDAAYAFCKESGPPYYAAKGAGQGRFHAGVTNVAKGHIAGQFWYTQVQPNRVKLVGLDADHWKLHCHNLFMTATYDDGGNFKSGAISLFSPGNDKRCHQTYSHHICAEIWTEEHIPDKGLKRGFKSKSHNNHWLDATAGACAAAAICGIKIVGEQPKPRKYVSLDSMAKRAS